MRFCLPRQFLSVSVCVTEILLGVAVAIAVFPPPPAAPAPPTLISICTTHLSWQWVDLPTDLWAIQPTCREVTDFKKAVSQRVKVNTADFLLLTLSRFNTVFQYFVDLY
jgi:hypothetical protein